MRDLMIMKLGILLMLSLTVLGSCTDGKISTDEKANVQTAMKEYVDAKLEMDKNAYRIGDKRGTFDYLHEGVKKKGDMYISCADVKVGNDVYDIDYFVKKENGEYSVVKETLHKINKEETNRVLWEK